MRPGGVAREPVIWGGYVQELPEAGAMPDRLRGARRKAVGAKETLRALEAGTAAVVYVAKNAERRVVRPVLEAADLAGMETVAVETTAELGRLCGIAVRAACAAILKGPLGSGC